jgi:DNA-binding transcriptional ArsR family regulator
MNKLLAEEARLTILRELHEQPSYSLNDAMLQEVLKTFGINITRAVVQDELRYLAEMGAVTLREAGSAKIAVLTDKGRDHVEYRIVITGVKRPSPRD